MNRFHNLGLFSLPLLWFSQICFSQTLDNVKASFDGDKVIITYDLNNADVNQKFKVGLYSSHDNYNNPISFGTGDIGENVLPGKLKRVVWVVKNSLPLDFDNDITIKVKATKMVAASKLAIKPLPKNAYKSGQSIDVQWQGGRPTDKINIALYKDGVMNQKLGENLNNNQTYKWSVPKGLKGKGYSLHVSDGSDQSTSQVFSIKPKVPLLYIIVPVVVVGGVVALLGGGSETPPTTVPSSDLPGPIKP